MEKVNYRKQELDLADRLLRVIESGRGFGQAARVTDPATDGQLRMLRGLGIRPLWTATRQEAEEMICHYKSILDSVKSQML